MGHDQDRARIIAQMALEPSHRLGIEMVGRLVEQQKFRRIQQQFAERDAAALATGKLRYIGIVRRTAQRIHGLVDLGIEIPQPLGLDLVLQLRHLVRGLVRIIHRELVIAVEDRLRLGDTLHDVFADGLGLVERRFLRQIADPRALGDPAVAREILVDAGHDPQQRGLARAVDAEHADFRVRVEGQMNVLEHLAVARVGLGQTLHMINELPAVHGPSRGARSCRCAGMRALM